jgi:hypothetical protein
MTLFWAKILWNERLHPYNPLKFPAQASPVTIFYNQPDAGNIQFTFLRHYNRSQTSG